MTAEAVTTDTKFLGKTFVLTGTLPNLKRTEAAALIEKAGGKVSGSVSKKTSYIVAAKKPAASLRRRRRWHPVLTEAELLTLLNGEDNTERNEGIMAEERKTDEALEKAVETDEDIDRYIRELTGKETPKDKEKKAEEKKAAGKRRIPRDEPDRRGRLQGIHLLLYAWAL